VRVARDRDYADAPRHWRHHDRLKFKLGCQWVDSVTPSVTTVQFTITLPVVASTSQVTSYRSLQLRMIDRNSSDSYTERPPRPGSHLVVSHGKGSNDATVIPRLESVEGQVPGEKPAQSKRKRTRVKPPQEEYLHMPWLDLLPVRQYDSVEQRLVATHLTT
jgi:hypothetical protein